MAAKILTVEIGNEFIKICDIQNSKKGVMVHNAISVQTPQDSVEDGLIKDINGVSDAIKTAMMQEQIISSEVIFVLNSSRVATKEVIIPLLKKEKIQGYIVASASEYFPVNINDYVLSYTILENKKEEKKSRVLVYAAPELIVESYFNLAKILGMRVKAVDYAGNSTLQLIKTQIDEKPTMVVQIGMDTTIVSIMRNDILQLQRTIPYGESLLLNAVIDNKKVSAKVAMELMSSARIVKDTLDKDEITGSLKYLVNNVNRVIEYYSGRNTELPLQKVIIMGDGADVLGMSELFSNETNLPAESLTLLKNVESYNRIKVSTSKLKQYMANIGACLEPIHLQPKTIVASSTQKNTTANSVPYYIVAGVIVVAAIAITVMPMIKHAGLKNDLEDYDDKIEQIKDIDTIMKDYYVSANSYKDLETFYKQTLNNSEYTPDFFKLLEEKLPSEMKIASLSINNGKASIKAVCNSKEQISQFVTAIKDAGNVYGYGIGEVTESDNGEVAFSMTIGFVSNDMFGNKINIPEDMKNSSDIIYYPSTEKKTETKDSKGDK